MSQKIQMDGFKKRIQKSVARIINRAKNTTDYNDTENVRYVENNAEKVLPLEFPSLQNRRKQNCKYNSKNHNHHNNQNCVLHRFQEIFIFHQCLKVLQTDKLFPVCNSTHAVQ